MEVKESARTVVRRLPKEQSSVLNVEENYCLIVLIVIIRFQTEQNSVLNVDINYRRRYG